VGSKSWNLRIFDEIICKFTGTWRFIHSTDELTIEQVEKINPNYIFFLHWSWKVPKEIIERFKCVCFHMADVPYGRGGSPLQNLIVRGHRETKLTALRMVEDFDAGPVYLQKPLSLEGNAEEIYIRAGCLSAKMIKTIIDSTPEPKPQLGEPVVFQRRKPGQSRVENHNSLHDLHDFIRMLDAEGYPKAFIEHKGFRYEFSRAAIYEGRIIADVSIRQLEKNKT
jgi:methionyl-tRNA formyltransferase